MLTQQRAQAALHPFAATTIICIATCLSENTILYQYGRRRGVTLERLALQSPAAPTLIEAHEAEEGARATPKRPPRTAHDIFGLRD